MDKKTKIIWKPINELEPYLHNAKEHNETQISNIAKSIKKYGWQNPVLVSSKNEIIAGHGRVMAARKLGLQEIPVIYADNLSEQQIREYRILDNKLNESEWIDSELEFELPELDFSDFDLDFDVELDFEEPKFKDDSEIKEEKFIVKLSFCNYDEYKKIESEIKDLLSNVKVNIVLGTENEDK